MLSALKPVVRRRHKTRSLLGKDPRRPGNQENRVSRYVLKRNQLWRINTQQSLTVMRHANSSEVPDSRRIKTKVRGEHNAFMETDLAFPEIPWPPHRGVPARSVERTST